MNRQIIYVDQNPLDTDQLNQSKNTLIALGMYIQAVLGKTTAVDGLACAPTAPASLQVIVSPGSIYSLENVDNTAYGSLAADEAHQIMKQGISLDPVTLNCPAPGTAGYSVNYLVQAIYQDTDTGPAVLPYYDSDNVNVAFDGPGGLGASQDTVREGQLIISAKAGVAATTGTQTTPAPDAGYTGLYVVTVQNTQTQITSPNIVQVGGAPFISEKLGDKISIPTGDARYQRLGSGVGRTLLTANANYYVSPAGNDSNSGTSGSPWLTPQHAVNIIQSSIDLGIFDAAVNCADGTYTGGVIVSGPFVGSGRVILKGNSGTPANCIFSTTNADAISVSNSTLHIQGLKVQTASGGNGIKAGVNGSIYIDGPMNYGSCYNDHINAIQAGAFIGISAGYTISGGCVAGGHWVTQFGGAQINCEGQAITLTGTPNFSSAFAYSDGGYLLIVGNTFSGAGTGSRYFSTNNGVVNTGGAGATYLPTLTGGSTPTNGGQYV